MSLNFVEKVMTIGGPGNEVPNLQFYKRGFVLNGKAGASPDWRDVILSGNTALTLVNSKANGLNWLRLGGATEQVPKEYVDSLTLEGKCEQNGTPTPETPIDIVCNNGVVKVNSQGQIYTDGTQETVTIDTTGGTATAEMLLGVGDYKDEQNITSGAVTRNVGVMVLDGSIGWTYKSLGSGIARVYTRPTIPGDTDLALCSHAALTPIKERTRASSPNTFQFGILSPNESYLGFKLNESEFADGDAWKTYLADQYNAGTPVIIIYPLATAATESVTPQPLDIPEDYVLTVTGSLDDLVATVDKSIHTTPTPTQPLDIRCNNGVVKVNSQGQIYTDGTQETVTIDTTGGTATAEMLLGVGDYKDTQEVLGGNVTRNMGIKVLDGTERYIKRSDYAINFSELERIYGMGISGICTHFQCSAGNAPQSPVGTMLFNMSNNYIHFFTEYGGNVNAFKQFLADQYANGTPVTIVYPLAEPTTETVTAQPLSIQEGTNIITAEGSIEDLELEVSYKATA